MIVVIKPSTGEIWRSRRTPGPMRTGRSRPPVYPLGSTFKMITAGAADRRDLAAPETLLGCPGRSTSGIAPLAIGRGA